MRVLLFNPPAFRGIRFVREGRCEQRLSSFQYNMLPVSLPTTAALLRREGHEVQILDAIALDLPPSESVERIEEFSPGLVLVNVSTPTFTGDSEVAALIKDAVPGAFIAAYGVHVTALPEESLEHSRFDAVIRGEPEVTAGVLAGTLESGSSLETVEGLSFCSLDSPGVRGRIVHNPDRPFLADLDFLPPAALDLVDHQLYPAPLTGEPHTLITTSRGCPHLCTFCTARLFYGARLRLRNPSNVVGEIEAAHKDQGIGLFTFWSDTFTLDRDYVLAICNELHSRKLKIRWMCNSRVDRVDPAMLRTMASAGCQIISYGVESGVQEILDNVKKGIRVSQIVEAFRWTRQEGIKTAAHVILGLPGEKPETIKKTLRLVKMIRPDFVQYYGAIPFPGTEFYLQCHRNGWLTTARWEDFEISNNIVSTPSLPAAQLSRWRRRAYLSFYLRPGYMAARLAEVRTPGELRRLVSAGLDFLGNWAIFAKGGKGGG